ncbi:flagella synthesis protein FlgN [Photobacterium sanguinicancri]|uniref:Flagellar export chaperone FlgN n=1 Tax=Photobacterium sanguinicancri TaxID=875932 RepID=A0AAW7Y978_9GAMM|nr:flagellar export chaperone FlgN [Photobacterium sanguinicancri]KXI24124.1 molecular chaperone [Photobacterium sanguinicancri]MDO6543542.1 flagellar export chaperone FlgN [Photobacterium sanguinicancri]OZS45636.1 molecular chaperone [Photobacterium sanguinicancri]
MSQTIDQLLELQHATLMSLSRLLEQEKGAIVSRQSTEIERIAKEKLNLIHKVQQQDHLIASHTQRQLLTESPTHIESVNTIKACAARCKELNEINGEALQRAQLSFHKLNNLFQQSRGKHQMTYNSEGAAQNIRTLGTNIKA